MAQLATIAPVAIVTLGADGAVAASSEGTVRVPGVQVEAVGHYAGPSFDAVRISVEVTGPTPDELADLIVAAERVCYVSNTLRAGADVTVTAE